MMHIMVHPPLPPISTTLSNSFFSTTFLFFRDEFSIGLGISEKKMVRNNKRGLVTCLQAIFPISLW
jgi:hypothetical protein